MGISDRAAVVLAILALVIYLTVITVLEFKNKNRFGVDSDRKRYLKSRRHYVFLGDIGLLWFAFPVFINDAPLSKDMWYILIIIGLIIGGRVIRNRLFNSMSGDDDAD